MDRLRHTELTREALGADGNAEGWTIDIRGYLPVVPPSQRDRREDRRGRGVWGDRLSAGGSARPATGRRPRIRLRHGRRRAHPRLDEDDVVGISRGGRQRGLSVSLRRIERGVGTWPAFARALHGAVFLDAGHAWEDKFRGSDVRVSLGAELSLDTVVGYTAP